MAVLGPTKDNVGRLLAYVGSVSGTVQYYLIGQKICSIAKKQMVPIVITAASTATETDTIALQSSCCNGVLPVVAASTMASVPVSQLLAGTILLISVVNISGIPTAVIVNR